MSDERLTEIEIKLAHAEQAISEMSDVIYAQQALLDKMEQRYDMLRQRISSVEADSDSPGGNEKPPHY